MYDGTSEMICNDGSVMILDMLHQTGIFGKLILRLCVPLDTKRIFNDDDDISNGKENKVKFT